MPLSTIFQLYRGHQVLLVEETRVPEGKPPTCHHIMLYREHLTWAGLALTMLVVDCIGSYKSNYHMITTTMAPKIKCTYIGSSYFFLNCKWPDVINVALICLALLWIAKAMKKKPHIILLILNFECHGKGYPIDLYGMEQQTYCNNGCVYLDICTTNYTATLCCNLHA
jgi:hypothetical protein